VIPKTPAASAGRGKETFAERLPFEFLRDDVRHALVRTDIVDGEEIGVAECPCGLRFLLEAAQAVEVGRRPWWQHLQGDLAPEAWVPRDVHLTHAACPEQAAELVGTQPRACSQRHGEP